MSAATVDLGALDSLNLDELEAVGVAGLALEVHFSEVYEDPENPRTEFDPTVLQALAEDIAIRGILQPIVVWPKDGHGYKIRYGAQRRRAAEIAAKLTGKQTVPITINDTPELDDYAQVAENELRANLTPLDLAKFIQRKVLQGETKAVIAKKLRMGAGRIPEYLSLLTMDELTKEIYESGRCISPQVLYMLGAVKKRFPMETESWLKSGAEITKQTVGNLELSLLAALEAPGVPGATPSIGDLPPEEGATAKVVIAPQERVSSSVGTKGAQKSSKLASGKPDPNIASLERTMTASLGARSTIQFNPKTHVGSVRIKFTSLEVLDGLLERFKIKRE